MAEESSIAFTIGSKLAEGLLSDGLSFGFDQLLSFAGVDTSGLQEVNAKLDEIIGMLKALEASVDQIKKQLDQMSYDNAVAPLLPLISQNDHLKERFTELLAMTNQDEIKKTKQEIRDSIYNKLVLDGAASLWNDCLTGTGSAKTSVIGAWGKLTYNHYNPVFGPDAAQAIQAQWDYFDAQQAFSVMFLVDYYRDQGEPESARGAINTWQQNRKAQLLLLHGNVKASDSIYTLVKGGDGTYTQQSESVSLACLPPGMIKAGNWLWLQHLVNNLPMVWWFGPMNPLHRGTTNDEPNSGFPIPAQILGSSADAASWRIPQLATLEDLFANIGAQIGQSQDHFADALANAGFAPVDKTPVRSVWFYQYGVNPDRYRTIFVGDYPETIEDPTQPKWSYTAGFFNENDSWCKVCDNMYQPVCLVAYNANSAALMPGIFGPLSS